LDLGTIIFSVCSWRKTRPVIKFQARKTDKECKLPCYFSAVTQLVLLFPLQKCVRTKHVSAVLRQSDAQSSSPVKTCGSAVTNENRRFKVGVMDRHGSHVNVTGVVAGLCR
jgi:hypothetical protein